MTTEVKVNAHKAETVYISHPEASYGIFCYNSVGDLFLNSDWGFHGYAWRSYGDDFKKFLAQCGSDYILTKFEMNWVSGGRKKMHPSMKKNVEILIAELIKYCKENPEWNSEPVVERSVATEAK